MVTDATVPSLVLLVVLAAAVVLARLVDHRLRHRAAVPGPRADAAARPALRLPRVVLLDDDHRAPVAA